MLKMPTPEQELRTLRKLAAETWLRAARKSGNPYTDRQALGMVKQQTMSALNDEDGVTILRSIIARMDRQSSPRRIPEWARLQGADERIAFHNARAAAERAERDQIIEYHGTFYLGHVPLAVGDRCERCGRTLADHRLAQKPRLRHVGEVIASQK